MTGSFDIANGDLAAAEAYSRGDKGTARELRRFIKFFGSYNVAHIREVLEETGGFDESYRRASGEDNDLGYRVLKLGFTIAFVPGALVGHLHTVRSRKYLREQYTHGYWRIKLYRAHPDMPGGDDYTRLKDIIEPPLAVLGLALIAAFLWFASAAFLFRLRPSS